MASFKERLEEALRLREMSPAELAKKTGIGEGAISQYRKGAYKASQRNLEKIASALSVSIPWLMGVSNEYAPSEKSSLPPSSIPFTSSHKAPILGTIPAGYPVLAFEDIEGYADIPYSDEENYFFLRVKGDSMEPKIRTGDLVLIRRQPCAEDGQIVAARVNGDEATLKRYKQQGDTVLLLPENPAYEPRIVSAADFESGYAQIIGVVLELRRAM